MQTAVKRVSELTVKELKTIIHNVISEDIEAWRETFEILSNHVLMKQIRQADKDWATRKKNAYIPWNKIKHV